MDKLLITPKTKIYTLLKEYPQLESVLLDMAPQFSKLKNPALRKTVTRITSLSQAAIIGGLKVEDLINKLRNEVGQTKIGNTITDRGVYFVDKPKWFDESKISASIDIREMLNVGEQPVHEVMSAIKRLNENQILKVIAPFIPAPLLDKALSLDYNYWLEKKGDEEYWVYFIFVSYSGK